MNLRWKEKSLKRQMFTKHVATSDEAFALFIMGDYDKIPTKEDRKKYKWMGERLDNVMKFFDGMMIELKQ